MVSLNYSASVCERFREDEFCNVCANYVRPKFRQKITQTLMDMYLEIYDLEMNLDYFAPSIICKRCDNAIRNYVLGISDNLYIQHPARWSDFRSDHSDCFYCHVKVRLDKSRVRTYLPKKCKTYSPPQFYPKKHSSHRISQSNSSTKSD